MNTRAGIEIDELSVELKDLAGVVSLLAIAAELDRSADDDYSATAYIIYNALLDIVEKMKLLSKCVIATERQLLAALADAGAEKDPLRLWITIEDTGSAAQKHYFATYDQTDQIRKILEQDDVPDDAVEKDDAESEENKI